jgi:hypothetical protein
MKKLKLKSRYEGLRVTRSDIRIGKITFDANTVKPEHYQNYYDLGFTELFEVIEEEPKKEIIVEDKLVKPKTKRPTRRKKKDEE